jgi:hypothetical protein
LRVELGSAHRRSLPELRTFVARHTSCS